MEDLQVLTMVFTIALSIIFSLLGTVILLWCWWCWRSRRDLPPPHVHLPVSLALSPRTIFMLPVQFNWTGFYQSSLTGLEEGLALRISLFIIAKLFTLQLGSTIAMMGGSAHFKNAEGLAWQPAPWAYRLSSLHS